MTALTAKPTSGGSAAGVPADPLAPSIRDRLRRHGDALPAVPIGTVPILWNNVDVEDLRVGTDATTILDEYWTEIKAQ